MIDKAMQELNQIESELQAILASGQQKEQEYMQEVETATQSELEANRAVIKAKRDGKAKEFAKANQDKRTAQDIKQFYLTKLEEAKSEPHITKEQHAEYSQRIKAQVDKANQANKARAGELLKELIAIKEEFEPVLQEGNALLKELQYSLAKDEPNKYNPNHDDKYSDFTLIQWVDYLTKQYASQQLLNHADQGGTK